MKWQTDLPQHACCAVRPCSHHSLFSAPDDAAAPVLFAHTPHCSKQADLPYRGQSVLFVKPLNVHTCTDRKGLEFHMYTLAFFHRCITVAPKLFAYGLAGDTQLAMVLFSSNTTACLKHNGYLQIKSQSKKVWKFIIDREIEAPARFQAIQSYRCAPKHLSPPRCI